MSLPVGGKADAAKAPMINSFDALKGAFVTDLAMLEASEFGVTVTDAEQRHLYEDVAGTTTAGKTGGAPATPGGASPSTPTSTTAPQPGADKKHVGPSGHEKIDIDRLDLEELTKRLFPRLRSSLRQELIVDRERAGRLSH